MVELEIRALERANILNNKLSQIYVFFQTIILILKEYRVMNWLSGIQERDNAVKFSIIKGVDKSSSFVVVYEEHSTGF